MLANWVQETTTTTGVGPVTLANISGFASFSDHFNTNDIVFYSIVDANGTSRESGMGTIASSTTLARTLVKETLVGGVIDNTNPAALTLTAGTHTVYISDAEGGQAPVDTWLYDSTYKDLGDNLHISGTQASAAVADQCIYCPILLQRPRLITNIGVNVSTADATTTIDKLGIYTCLPDGSVGTLIESVNIDVSTTGLKSVALASPRLLSAGWYYSAFASDGTPSVHMTPLHDVALTPYGINAAIPRTYVPYQNLTAWSDLPATSTPIFALNYAPIMYWS